MVEIYDKTKNKALSRYKKYIGTYANKAFRTLKISNKHSFSVIICGSEAIKKLNKEYRNINKTTDVLSFEEYDIDSDDMYLGEVFVNVDRVYSQAKKYKHSIKREYIFLVIHGLLHLCGYDHVTSKKDEKIMFALQDAIVGDLK